MPSVTVDPEDDTENSGTKARELTPLKIQEFDFSKLEIRPRNHNIDRHRSCEVKALFELSMASASPRHTLKNLDHLKITEHLENAYSPSWRSNVNSPKASISSHLQAEAWEALRRSLVHFRGRPVGTIAAMDPSEEALNYNQVFVRDFVPSALAFLMGREPEIVRNFLTKTLRLQSWEKKIDRFQLGAGVMPASFKVFQDPIRNTETLIADFGESAIGRVAPVDSGFWWIILLRAYTRATGDSSLADTPDCQQGIRLILSLCLSEGFDTFPTLLCADGCCMIDRRMGIYGYPIEIQALFFMALRLAIDFVPNRGGYFIGNVSPARMDFRWFCLGNCIAILSSLATPNQSAAIMDLLEARWTELVGEMPLKVCYPALENHEWRVITGCDPKNTRWSYHNGGSWPDLVTNNVTKNGQFWPVFGPFLRAVATATSGMKR
ncbi:hypothetical protein C4D60_Mb11t14370 [Musa balbisiana]|uniref:Alkaline/neutral invertase n=1 Tax=Musa balbisiana TaxID=52838 RepID=A0A4S8J486_MUSBA|nr:hypothetical protein C4D60_Mb11t14370 [Musa balbisiana]